MDEKIGFSVGKTAKEVFGVDWPDLIEEGREKVMELRKKIDDLYSKSRLSPQQKVRLESLQGEYGHWSLVLLTAEAIINIKERLTKVEKLRINSN